MINRTLILILTSVLFSFNGFSQETGLTQKIPFDPDVKTGTLENGLTYYIRHNEQPKDRAELYLVVNAGAILENDDQDGLAHFCEHMAFNGTKNFEKHDIINYLQSIGMKFGPEINAFTSHDVTNYMLQKVPTDVTENIDTALMILYDWASNVSFEDEEIDNERGVIHEEWRTRRGAQFRMMTETNKTLYKGSKYAERDIIGNIDIIDNCSYETLRDFYKEWYRPDLQAVIAVGDFDITEIENKIKDLFSQTPKRENPKERMVFEVPDHQETHIAVETDPEAQYSIVQLYYKHPVFKEKNLEDYRKSIIFSLYNQMLNKRLQEKLQEENPPFIYGYSAYTSLVRSKDAYVSFAVAKNDGIERTLETLVTENERVKRHGFSASELEREKKEYLSNLEKSYNEKDKKQSSSYVWKYFSHYLENEPTPGIEFEYEFAREVMPDIKLSELNELAENWVTEENRVVAITAPEKEEVIIPEKKNILSILDKVNSAEIEAYNDEVSNQPLIPFEPILGKVEKTSKNRKLETEEWLLSNGIRVVLKPTDFKEDEILMRAYSMGGSSLHNNDELPSADFSTDIITESGLGNYDKIQLQKMMAGKMVSLYPYVSETREGFRGSSSVKDFETLLQMVYAYFNFPRANETSYKALMSRMKGMLENRRNNPSSAFQDTITVTMADYHPRVQLFDTDYLEQVNFETSEQIFKERFEDPSSFTFYFVGNIDTDIIKPLIEKYIGGLIPVNKNETFKDHGIRPPEGIVEKTVVKNMKVPKATVYVSFTGEIDFNDYMNRLNLSALCDILDIRYTESIREEQGGTYGVAVYPSISQYPYENYKVMVRFDCDPENADKLKQIVYDEIETIKENGPLSKDLKSVKENKLKTRKENLEKNSYWINKLVSIDYDNLDIKNHLKYDKYVENINQEDLKETAGKFFGENRVEIILLPENTEDNIKNPLLEKKDQ